MNKAKTNSKRSLFQYILFFEAALIVALVQFSLENFIQQYKMDIYLKVAVIMLMAGGILSVGFALLQKIVQGTLGAFNKLAVLPLLQILFHLVVLAILYYLFSLLYFNLEVVTL